MSARTCRQSFHREPVAQCVETTYERFVETATVRIEPIPIRSRRRNFEQFHLIAAAGHRIGQPRNRVICRERASIRRAIKLDPVDCTGLTLAHGWVRRILRSEEHTSELQSLMRISYAVFCLK